MDPASTAVSLKPLIMSGMTMSRSCSDMREEQAISISMLSHSVTPIAYRSLRTLQQAILPGKKRESIQA